MDKSTSASAVSFFPQPAKSPAVRISPNASPAYAANFLFKPLHSFTDPSVPDFILLKLIRLTSLLISLLLEAFKVLNNCKNNILLYNYSSLFHRLQQHRNTASAHHALFLGIISVHADINRRAFEFLFTKEPPAATYNLSLRTSAAYCSYNTVV